jgi:hypothetical protein
VGLPVGGYPALVTASEFPFSVSKVCISECRSPGRTPSLHPATTDPGSSAPVRSVRSRNSMHPIDFSANRSPGFRHGVRDGFGRDQRSKATPEKRLAFFGLVASRQ